MRSFRNLFIASAITVSLFLAYSCTPGACFDEMNAFMKASLYRESTGIITPPDSLSLWGAGRDTSKIYDAIKSLKQASFPLDDSSVKCKFTMKINGVYDTITVWYSTYPHLISKECGYIFYHDLDSIHTSNHKIVKLSITKNSITNQSEENIRIYY
jgi:hypothetical protein